jgi:hypothetical protein
VLPFAAALAGIACATLFELGRLRDGWQRAFPLAVAGGILISGAHTIKEMVILHPYQSIYFNPMIAGGLENAWKKFDTDYWGNSYREGIEWVLENYHPETSEKIRVRNCSTGFLMNYFLFKDSKQSARFELPNDTQPSHLLLSIRRHVLSIQRHDCWKTEGRLLHIVERKGAPLLYVKEVTSPKP